MLDRARTTSAEPPSPVTTSRVILRSRVPPGTGALYYMLAVEIPHFIMERRMLKGIKHRAERAA